MIFCAFPNLSLFFSAIIKNTFVRINQKSLISSLILGFTLDKCPDPRVVISKALENAGILASNIEVVNVTSSNEGRQVDITLSYY